MRTGVVVGFALCACLVIGFVAGTEYSRRVRNAASIRFTGRSPSTPNGLPDSVLRARDPERWVRDSMMLARARSRTRAMMREIARSQALANCAVSFEVRDTIFRKNWLLHAEARDARRASSGVISKGWAYTTRGFRPGDTVIFVMPNVFCGDIVISSFGGAHASPPPPLALDVR